MTELVELSRDARRAVAVALDSLPDDANAPVPMCERVNQINDALIALTKRDDLAEKDRAILLAFCTSSERLQNFIAIAMVWDELAMVRHNRNSR